MSDFTVSRYRDGPDLFLIDSGYQGTLLGDCYGANTGIEDRAAVMDAEARLELRQTEAAPVWERIRDYIATQTLDLLPKDTMRGAINYLRNQWDGLTR